MDKSKKIILVLLALFILHLEQGYATVPIDPPPQKIECAINPEFILNDSRCFDDNCSINISRMFWGGVIVYELNINGDLFIIYKNSIEGYFIRPYRIKSEPDQARQQDILFPILDAICLENTSQIKEVIMSNKEFEIIKHWGNDIIAQIEREKKEFLFGECLYSSYEKFGRWILINYEIRDYCYKCGPNREEYCPSAILFVLTLLMHPSSINFYNLLYILIPLISIGGFIFIIIYLIKRDEIKKLLKPTKPKVIWTILALIGLLLFRLSIENTNSVIFDGLYLIYFIISIIVNTMIIYFIICFTTYPYSKIKKIVSIAVFLIILLSFFFYKEIYYDKLYYGFNIYDLIFYLTIIYFVFTFGYYIYHKIKPDK